MAKPEITCADGCMTKPHVVGQGFAESREAATRRGEKLIRMLYDGPPQESDSP